MAWMYGRGSSGEGRGVQWWLLVAWMYGMGASGEGGGVQWSKCICSVGRRWGGGDGWADNFSNYSLFKIHQIT